MRLTALVPLLWLAGALGRVWAAGFPRDADETASAAPGASGTVAVSDGRAPTGEKAQNEQRRTWTGRKGVRYERSYRICSVFTVKEVAAELGVARKPKPAARAHANAWYDAPFRTAAYHGCLDAFRGRPPAVR